MARAGKPRGWRKIAGAVWRHPNDPQIYGDLEIDASAMLAYAGEARRVSGLRITMTHLVGKGVAHALAENPDVNIRWQSGRLVPRESVDIFFIVSTEGGSDLTGIKVEHTDRKSVIEIAQEIADRLGRIRRGEDEQLGRTKKMMDITPRRLLGRMTRLSAWLTSDRNLDLKGLGLPRQAFGSAMVSSVGMFGIQHAYAPLSPVYRVPFLVLVGEVAQKPVVVEGVVVPRPLVNLAVTIDHRFLDGFHAARLARSALAYFKDPASFEPPLTPMTADRSTHPATEELS